MHPTVSIRKHRVKDEEHFIIAVEKEGDQVIDPFMSTSGFADPLTKQEAIDELRRMEVAEEDIQRLLANAGNLTT